jgi:hypothetical protein
VVGRIVALSAGSHSSTRNSARSASWRRCTFPSAPSRAAGPTPQDRYQIVNAIIADPAYVFSFKGSDTAAGLAKQAISVAATAPQLTTRLTNRRRCQTRRISAVNLARAGLSPSAARRAARISGSRCMF